jgi:hypothetical protein
MNRRRALILLGGSGVFAGCAAHGAPLLHLPAGDGGRRSDDFPRRRPDGSLPPSSAAAYHPKVQLIGTPAPRHADVINRICTPDSCPGSDPGSPDTTQPSTALRIGGLIGYYFSSQNYLETWSDDGTTLYDQWYWSINTSLSQYGAQLVRRRHDVAIGGGPTKPCDTCSTRQQNVGISVNTPGGTFTATHDNGWSISGRANGAGNVALTAWAAGDVATATVVYQPPSGVCASSSLQACAAIAPIVLNVVATATGCSTSPETCTAAGLMVGAMTAGTIDAVREWQAAAGC